MNVGKMIYGIIGLIITFILLSGGLSGTMVLRGTDSSSALVIVALIFLVGDLAYIYGAYREGEVKSEAPVKDTSEKIQTIDKDYVAGEVKAAENVSVEAVDFKPGCGKTSLHFDKN